MRIPRRKLNSQKKNPMGSFFQVKDPGSSHRCPWAWLFTLWESVGCYLNHQWHRSQNGNFPTFAASSRPISRWGETGWNLDVGEVGYELVQHESAHFVLCLRKHESSWYEELSTACDRNRLFEPVPERLWFEKSELVSKYFTLTTVSAKKM